MQKVFTYTALFALFIVAACSETNVTGSDDLVLQTTTVRGCAAMEVLEAQLLQDPAMGSRMDAIEHFTDRFIESGGRLTTRGKIEIPVVVNILYNTASENISLEQIQSQIDVLNEDFNATNHDARQTPSIFSGAVADVDVQFVLAAVNRKYSSKRSWQVNDGMKRSRTGGIDATDPSQYLNIWVVNRMTSGQWIILGYAQFPGGNPATDGVVVGHNFFGRTGVVSAPFDKGRTATHEVGHWLNLRHIWGDATCGNDFVSDTPLHNTANFDCPTYPHRSTCAGTPVEMTMNYMDYTDDACMFMFTNGQKQRMTALFDVGGARASFAQ